MCCLSCMLGADGGCSQQEIRERLEPASWVQRTLERIVLKAKQRKIPDCTGKSVEILMQGFPLLGHRTRPPSQPIIWDIELTLRGLVQSLDEICHAVLLPQGFSHVPVAMIHRLASLWGLYSVKYRLFRVSAPVAPCVSCLSHSGGRSAHRRA